MTQSKTNKTKKSTGASAKTTRLYEEGVRRTKILDRVSVAVVTLIILGLALLLPQSPEGEGDRISQIILLIGVAITLQGVVMIRQAIARIQKGREAEVHPDDYPLKGWKFTYFTPLIALVVLLPWILAGVFNDDDFGPLGASFLLLILFAMALLLSTLVAAFILAPLELMARGVLAAIKGDKSRVGYLYSGGFIALVTAFILTMGLGVDTDSTFPASIPAQFAALFGLPGAYGVENEVLLWAGRGLAAVLTGIILLIAFSRPSTKKK